MGNEERAMELLRPIMDVMSGSDGGVAFARLRFIFIPDILTSSDKGDPLSADFIRSLENVSKICAALLDGDG
jgi:hypothetical protein